MPFRHVLFMYRFYSACAFRLKPWPDFSGKGQRGQPSSRDICNGVIGGVREQQEVITSNAGGPKEELVARTNLTKTQGAKMKK